MSFPDFSIFFGKKDCVVHPKEPLIKLVTRDEWGAVPATSTVPLELPATYVRYTFTATPESSDPAENVETLKRLQKTHMETLGLPDIQYNFLIGGDGTVYEGRGWNNDSWKPDQHKELHGKSLDVAYMGEYTNEGCEPNWEMMKAGQNFLKHAIELKYLDRPFKVVQMRE